MIMECATTLRILTKMKVGDLVKQISWDGYGVITKVLPFNGYFVLFSDGEYRLDGDMMEVINASR